MEKNAKYITYLATFTALATLANCFTIPFGGGTNFISLVYIPCFLAGIFLGPIAGFAVGAIGDLLGILIMPFGPWMPLITLASGLLGFIPGIVFKFVKTKYTMLKLLVSIVLCLLICTAGLNTLGTFLLYAVGKKTFFVYLGARFPVQCLMATINFVVIGALLKVKPLTKILTIKK